VNQFDLGALALVLAFGYRGYRVGLLGVVLGLTGSLLAFALAAVLAPLLAPAVAPLLADRLGVPSALVRPLLVVGLTLLLRVALGFVVGEVRAVLQMIVRAVPPLALLDRLLGVLPLAGLGALLGVGVVLAAINLPLGAEVQESAERSWTARRVIAEPRESWTAVRDGAERLLTDPPRVNGYALAAGTVSLAVAAGAARRLRGPTREMAREAPTVRRVALAASDAPDPLAPLRATFGVGVGLALAAALF
jgi:uncharacterized membrane protein required for colicin V production